MEILATHQWSPPRPDASAPVVVLVQGVNTVHRDGFDEFPAGLLEWTPER